MEGLDFSKITCPRCGKKHFKVKGESPLFGGFFGNDLFRDKSTEAIYKDGVLQNPQNGRTEGEKCVCLECNCNFTITRKWSTPYDLVNVKYNIEITDDEAVRKAILDKLEEALKIEEEAERKDRLEHPEKYEKFEGMQVLGVNAKQIVDNPVTASLSSIEEKIKNQISFGKVENAKSTLDLGGITFYLIKTFTEEEIKNIEKYFGWKVENIEE